MKIYLFLASFISFSAFSSTHLSFQCDMNDYTYVAQFSLTAQVEVSDSTFHNAEFDFLFRKAGSDSQIERVSTSRDGEIKVYEGGTLYRHRVIHLTSTDKNAEIKLISILIDGASFTSRVVFSSGANFLGHCKSL